MTIFCKGPAVGMAAAVAIILLSNNAGFASEYAHVTDPEACFDGKDRSPDEQIAACLKGLNSHMLNRNGVALALSNLSVAYRRKGDEDSALAVLNAAIKLEGDTWQALVNRAGVYENLNKPDLALADLNRAVAIAPSEATCFRARGAIYLHEQKFDLAAADFSQALANDPKDARSLFLRSEARQRLGDGVGAAADLAAAKQLDPNIERLGGAVQSKSTLSYE